MRKVRKFVQILGVAVFCLTVMVAGLATAGPAQSGAVDARADQLLHQMSDYLAGLKQFRVLSENSLEVILRTGEKIQFNSPTNLALKRPNKLRADRSGDIVNQELYYDGSTLTLFHKDLNLYATVEAPGTIDETIDFAREFLDLYAPGSDLMYANVYNILTEDVVSGAYIGMSVIDGARCHHLAFRANDVDWQIWIEAGDKPLPKKFIVTSKWMTGAPQFVLLIKSWDLHPDFTDDMFTFVPPKDAKQIDFVVSRDGAASER